MMGSRETIAKSVKRSRSAWLAGFVSAGASTGAVFFVQRPLRWRVGRVVQLRTIELADGAPVVRHLEDARAIGRAEFGQFRFVEIGELAQLRQGRFLHREDHALLAFADEDLPAHQPGFLQLHLSRSIVPPHSSSISPAALE